MSPNPYFGARWDEPLLDSAEQVPTPVGELCLDCGEPVEDGDRGLMTPAFLADPSAPDGYAWVVRAQHLECHLRSTMSHRARQCRCFVPGRSLRDEARATLVAVDGWRAEAGLGPL